MLPPSISEAFSTTYIDMFINRISDFVDARVIRIFAKPLTLYHLLAPDGHIALPIKVSP